MSTTTRSASEPTALDGQDEPPTSAAKGRRRVVAIVVGAVAATAGAAWLLLGSPLFDVDEVAVTGNSGIPTEEVVSASGIVPGTPLLTLDTNAAADRVSQLDAVASASVARQWPDAVAITVVPDAAVAFSPNGDQWDVWGAAGGRLSVAAEVPADLPELRDVPEQSRAEALAVIGSLPADVRSRVGGVSLQEGRGYLLELKDDAGTVRWGDAADSQLKGTVLAAMMAAAPDARWFDVSSPTAPRSAVAEPARVPRNGATPSPTPSDGTATATTDAPTDESGANPAETGGEPAVPQQGGGGESPLGLQPQ